ncbi:MAG: hypothetical protein AAF623_03675 [Planctomycetota bacterium]
MSDPRKFEFQLHLRWSSMANTNQADTGKKWAVVNAKENCDVAEKEKRKLA